MDVLKESDVEAAIVLAFNATDPTVKGKMDILEVGGSGQTKGMLQVAKECGITCPIIDVAAMPLGAGSGATIRSVPTIKGILGLPVGGGFHNMASAWDWFRKFKKTQPDPKAVYMPTDIGTNLVAQIAGADLPSLWTYRERQRSFPCCRNGRHHAWRNCKGTWRRDRRSGKPPGYQTDINGTKTKLKSILRLESRGNFPLLFFLFLIHCDFSGKSLFLYYLLLFWTKFLFLYYLLLF